MTRDQFDKGRDLIHVIDKIKDNIGKISSMAPSSVYDNISITVPKDRELIERIRVALNEVLLSKQKELSDL